MSLKITPKEGRQLLEEYVKENFAGKNGVFLLAVATLGFVTMALGLFVVLVPVTYALGGIALYREHNWQFWQPGVGGIRFVALNGISWTLYAFTLIVTGTNLFLGDVVLGMAGFGTGFMSYAFMCAALLTYQNDKKTRETAQVSVPSEQQMLTDRTFNEDLEQSALLNSGEGVTSLWWLFIAMNTFMCVAASWIALVSDFHAKRPIFKLTATILVLWMIAGSTAITHAIGGQWKHISTGYMAFQPGKGGKNFVMMQGLGWTSFSLGQLVGLIAFASQASKLTGGKGYMNGLPLISLAGLLGLAGQLVVAASLFYYEAPTDSASLAKTGPPQSMVFDILRKTQFLGLNVIFAGGSTYEKSRTPKLSGPDDYLLGEKKFQELTKDCKTTGDQYLIIGVGFVGKRLVQRLLERGETRIRLFDIVPTNPFAGDDRIEYVRGDVTKYDQVLAACKGVDTVYSTFAIIRFMDRLAHQAALSYRINVGGTENVLKACREQNVKRIVVTSSSHATTDEHSEPRFDRDENAPYVVRETAHNHYGWTKAAADIMCLNANGQLKADGTPIQIAIIRPCSGVFGGDDRISFEKAMSLGVFPGVGAKKVMDWVYVENVVLGHILLEAALQRNDPDIAGQAFNISNNEAVKNEDMWFTVMKIIRDYAHPDKVKSTLDLIFIPEQPLWAIGYVSELNQRIFKGKVSLGRDLDMLTPGMLATAVMEYSYNSDKAKKFLGYEPAYSLDQAIQKSLYEYWELHFPSANKKTQ